MDERGVSVIVATHEPILIVMGDRVLELRDGVLSDESEVAATA